MWHATGKWLLSRYYIKTFFNKEIYYICMAILKWKSMGNNKHGLTCRYAFKSFFLFSKKSLSILLKVFLPGSFNMLDKFSN